jgi:hypothetical protein
VKALRKIRYSLAFPRMQTIGKDLYLSSVRNKFGKSARLVPATILACGCGGAGGGESEVSKQDKKSTIYKSL